MIRTVENQIVFTSSEKPQVGDMMCCHAVGISQKDRHGKRLGEKWYLCNHDDSVLARLNAICVGTEKVDLIIDLPKLK